MPEPILFDQKGVVVCVGSPSVVEFNDLSLKFGIFKPIAEHVEHIGAFAAHLNDHARGIARKILRTERRIPAHDDPVAAAGQGGWSYVGNQMRFNEIAAFGHRCLLILGRVIHRAHASLEFL